MLPDTFIREGETFELEMEMGYGLSVVYRKEFKSGGVHFGSEDQSEPDARAKMLVYLLENKLISLKQPQIYSKMRATAQ